MDNNKERRQEIHKAVKESFPSLETKTEDVNGHKVIIAMHRKGQGELHMNKILTTLYFTEKGDLHVNENKTTMYVNEMSHMNKVMTTIHINDGC